MLKNEGAVAAMGMGVVPNEEPVKPKDACTVDEANELLDEHADGIKYANTFKKNDIVTNSELVAVSESPLKDGQKAIVVMAGKSASDYTGDPERDVIINYISVGEGKLSRAGLNNRFLKKTKL